MAAAATHTFTNTGICSIYPHHTRKINVNLAPNLTLAQGTILGEIQLNDVWSLSTGTQGSGTFTLSFGGVTTSALARNITAPNLQIALLALSSVGAGNATVVLASGTPGTDAVYTITFTGALGYAANTDLTADLSLLATPSNAALTHAITGQALGTYKAYVDGNSDGSQSAKGVLEFNCVTNSTGDITLGSQAGGGPFGQTQKAVPMFIGGTFYTSELTGLDAAAVTDLGRLLEGTTTNGILQMP
jgi:hypothetical protein